jgi:hypothetical protein
VCSSDLMRDRLNAVARGAAVTALLTSGVLPSSLRAQAFPASGDQVIRAMHERYASSWYRTLTFTQKTTRRTDKDSTVVETWKESAMIPGHLRIDVRGATPPQSYIYAGDSLFILRGDSVRRIAQRNILLIIGFDVYRQGPEKTLADLRSLHFAMTPVHEGSWQGHEVYVIGAAEGDLHSPQLWIDRDRLLFLRGLEPDERDSTKTIEYRFDDYTLYPGGWLSRTVMMSVDGKVAQKEEYSNVEIGNRLDVKLFQPPQ